MQPALEKDVHTDNLCGRWGSSGLGGRGLSQDGGPQSMSEEAEVGCHGLDLAADRVCPLW